MNIPIIIDNMAEKCRVGHSLFDRWSFGVLGKPWTMKSICAVGSEVLSSVR